MRNTFVNRTVLGICLASGLLLGSAVSQADGPADNQTVEVRRIPKLGIEVPAPLRAELETGLAKLKGQIDGLRAKTDAKTKELLPDVEIFYKAVHDALTYQEFFDPKELDEAKRQLTQGEERAKQLAAGEAPWTTATGLVVRGYVSKIDGSVQPYGLVVPASYSGLGSAGFRLDVWLHGRGEVLSELNFLKDRASNPGQFTPPHTFVLHPYGRYCNAFKFAGEVDIIEALAAVQRQYHIDEDRIGMRGFSMGGAGCWQMAVHYADHWFAAAPGAGFSETPDFLKVFQKESLAPTPWEKKLWHWYDCPDWCDNLLTLPTIAYSGEEDIQKQAADMMERAMQQHDLNLLHLIGPKTKHAYHPASAVEIERRMTALAKLGRPQFPTKLNLVTYTLRYPQQYWLRMDGLQEHWTRSRIRAEWEDDGIHLSVDGVTDLTIDIPAGAFPLEVDQQIDIFIGEDPVTPEGVTAKSDGSLKVSLYKEGGDWKVGPRPTEGELRKKPGLQGPVDDAFMDSFLFVRPTGKAWNEQPAKWASSELTRASEHWRRQFRGVARVKDDTAITDEDLANHNLVLWGDPASNAILAKIAAKLPIQWTKDEIVVGEQKFPAASHALIAIYPNPLNPEKYVVLNSSFTYRDYAYLNNARQVPMLPDWAVIDLTTPAGSVWPGKVTAADFFDEAWKVK